MRRLILVLLLLVAVVGRVRAEDEGSALTEEDRADLAFFQGLGFTDVAGTPYVEVTTGRGWKDDDGAEHLSKVRGFLLAEGDGGTFEVLTDDLFVRTYVTTAADVEAIRRVGFARLDLAAEVDGTLTKLKARAAGDDSDDFGEEMWLRHGERLSQRGQLLAMACACAQHELESRAHDLLDAARGVGAFWNGETDEGPLRKDLYEEFSTSLVWRAVEAFGDPAIGRPALQKTFRDYLETFGKSKHAKTAQEAVDLLTTMIEEDEAHAKAAKPWAEMTKEEQIADLVFRLRDQNGGQFMQPGSPSIFFSMRDPDDDTAAHQLVALGYDAVPQLIEALDDKRFTRTVGFWRNFVYSHYVVRIGDACLEILQRIAGRGFWQGTYTAASMVKDGEEATTKQKAQAWWKDFQSKGERQALIDAVRRGDGQSSSQAYRLLKRFPDDALAAIVAGIENAEDGRARFYLVQILANDVPGEAKMPALLSELREGPTLKCRLKAASWLIRHGHDEAIAPMIEAWRQLGHRERWESDDVDTLAGFLVHAGTTEAIRALADGFSDRAVHLRYSILDRLHYVFPRHEAWPPLTPEAERLLEEFLVRALDDREETGSSSSSGGRSVDDVRVADMAARVLAKMWDAKDAFDYYAMLHERDRQLLDLHNRCAKQRGLEPRPDPEAVPIPRLSDAESRALLAAWTDAPTPDAKSEAYEALRRHGLAVLPALRSAADVDDELARLAQHLAFVVHDVRVLPKGATLGLRSQRVLDRLRGRALETQLVRDALRILIAELRPGARGVVLTIHRIGNDRGAVVTVEVAPVPRGRELRAEGGWSVDPSIKVGHRSLLRYNSWTDGLEAPEFSDGLWKAIDEALAAAPEKVVRIRVSTLRGLVATSEGPIPLERVLKDAGLTEEK